MIIVTEELRRTLIQAVQGEGWDEGLKAELVENLRALPNGPYDDSNDYETVEYEDDLPDEVGQDYVEDSLSSLIDYFGVWHLAPSMPISLVGVEVNMREVFDRELREDPVVCTPVYPTHADGDQLVGVGPSGTDRDWIEVRPMSKGDILEDTQGVTLVAYRLRWRRKVAP